MKMGQQHYRQQRVFLVFELERLTAALSESRIFELDSKQKLEFPFAIARKLQVTLKRIFMLR
jgi:hypothetical protein